MIQVWTMPGLHGTRGDDDPLALTSALLSAAAELVAIDDEVTLPAWRVVSDTVLPPLVIEVTPTFVIACALATRDFQDVTGQYIMTSYYRDDLAALPEMGVVARQLWRQAGLRPADVRTAVLYDHFTPYVLIQLEELGFCARGEASEFIAGGAIELGGRLPLNPHGGQLGEAYIHGMNGIAEAVRQVRGTSVNIAEPSRQKTANRNHSQLA